MFRKILDQGQAGDNVGCLLRGIKREEIERGQVLCKPGSITPHTKFKAEVYVPEEGGGRPSHAVLHRLPAPVLLPHHRRDRHRQPPRGVEMVMPGDNVEMEIELIQPIAMDRACGSPSARAAARSARASSPRSSSKHSQPGGGRSGAPNRQIRLRSRPALQRRGRAGPAMDGPRTRRLRRAAARTSVNTTNRRQRSRDWPMASTEQDPHQAEGV